MNSPRRGNEATCGQPVGLAVRGSNQSGMRAHNERLVMTLIRQLGPLAKAEIARLSGLSAQTVSVIMRSLEADGLLEKGDPLRGKVGQPSIPMNLVPGGAYFLGLKVGRRSLDLVLTDFMGRVRSRVRHKYEYPSPDSVVAFARGAIEELVSVLPAGRRDRIQGLGIAIPFRLWEWDRALNVAPGAMNVWRDRDIAAEIARNWSFPVYLQNDATAACGAELVFGDQSKPRDFLYFFIGFFAGGGVVIDNTLLAGRTGNAGALGSMPVRTGHGASAQLVDMASLHLLERMSIEAGTTDLNIWDDPDDWSVPDATLDAWLATAADGLAQAIIASCCVIDFEAAYVDGWLPTGLRSRLVDLTDERICATGWAGINLPDIRPGSVGSDARALGAASIPLSDRFLVDRNALLKS